MDAPWGRRCTATNRQGARCGRWAIRGGTVCKAHGGGSPQVKRRAEERLQAAQERFLDLLEPAVNELARLLDEFSRGTA